VDEQEARQCLGALGLQGKTAASAPLLQLSGGQKVRIRPSSENA
jgi:ATPase subunit of ABC transporter with duplicated ATPase domains